MLSGDAGGNRDSWECKTGALKASLIVTLLVVVVVVMWWWWW